MTTDPASPKPVFEDPSLAQLAFTSDPAASPLPFEDDTLAWSGLDDDGKLTDGPGKLIPRRRPSPED